MPKPKRLVSTIYPYHVTARSINREWFRIPIQETWHIFCDYLYTFKFGFDIDIQSFVLMNNHFHMLLKTPKGNLGEAMHYLMMNVSKSISRDANRINQTFGGPYHSSLITNNHYCRHAYKYIYRNPIESGICHRAELYPYSTLSGLLGYSKLHIPVSYDEILYENLDQTLDWINTPYINKEDYLTIGSALRHNKFKFTRDRVTRQPHPLEIQSS